jgi:hypothetical protein
MGPDGAHPKRFSKKMKSGEGLSNSKDVLAWATSTTAKKQTKTRPIGSSCSFSSVILTSGPCCGGKKKSGISFVCLSENLMLVFAAAYSSN